MVNRFKLAQALAAVLQTAVPTWLSVTAADEHLLLTAPAGMPHTIYSWEDDVADDALCQTLGCHALDELQDFVCEYTTTPWPPVPGRAADMALPGARVQQDSLYLWYGEPDAPTLQVTPIDLREIWSA